METIMTNEKKLEIAINLLSEKALTTFSLVCAEYRWAEQDYLMCPHCNSQIEHGLLNSFLLNDKGERAYQYECNDCGRTFNEYLERTRITK